MADETKTDPVADPSGDPKIKVTDKRMFTAEGELREGFEHLEHAEGSAPATAPEPEPKPPPEARPEPAPESVPATENRSASVEMPESPGALGSPGFLDLVGVLAEPIALYLGDAKLPDGSSAENHDAARFYIDLLGVLQAKSAGNLTTQEDSVLEDLLYQLRMRYVRQQG